jgi:hypothetical protein
MSPTRHHRRRLVRLAYRAARHAGRMGLAVVAVCLAGAVAGPVVAAAVDGLGLTVWAVAWWARVVEPRLFAQCDRATPRAAQLGYRAPVGEDERHVAFARALVLVAARYLAECEHQARRGGGGR